MAINSLTEVENSGLETGKPMRSRGFVFSAESSTVMLLQNAGFMHVQVWHCGKLMCMWGKVCRKEDEAMGEDGERVNAKSGQG